MAKKGKGKGKGRSKKKKFEAAATVCRELVSKTALALRESKSLASLKNISSLSLAVSRRERTTQYSMDQPEIPDTVLSVRSHSPHQLSMIEEASQESFTLPEGLDEDNSTTGNHPGEEYEHESSYILEQCIEQDVRYDGMASIVGPHGFQHGGLAQNTAETVLYGAWEQDNNLDNLTRCSTPGTVIHHEIGEMDDADGGFEASSSSSSAVSYQPSGHGGQVTQNANFNMTGVSKMNDWSMFCSSLVDYGPDEPSPRIPGCSAGHPYKKTWKLTDSMMMAYNAMRGPMMVPGNDPLRGWMAVKANEILNEPRNEAYEASREGRTHSSPKGKGTEPNVGGDTTGANAQASSPKNSNQSSAFSREERQEMESYAKMLHEANMAAREYAPAEMDRKPVYEVPRPRYLHVSPKFDFNFKAYMPPEVAAPDSAYKQPFESDRNFEEEYDISDDEGDPESGRISPCTFRLLAEGCSLQNPKANQVFMAEDAQRMRPATPVEENEDHNAVDRLALDFQVQKDVHDGGWLTPCYSLESQPSIIFSPPGVTFRHKMRNWWFGLFDRMDPLTAKRFRKIEFREPNDPVTPLGTPTERLALSTSTTSSGDDPIGTMQRPYTEADVREALQAPTSRRVAGIAPQNAELIISQRWQTVTRWKRQDAELAVENARMKDALAHARVELRQVRLAVDHLLQKRAAEELATRRRRHRRILRQVSAHLHELRYEIQSKFDALKAAQSQNQGMRAELALLEFQIKNECARAEMTSPEQVRKAVSQHFRDKLDKLDQLELADCF